VGMRPSACFCTAQLAHSDMAAAHPALQSPSRVYLVACLISA
jgi:hypothetical protein